MYFKKKILFEILYFQFKQLIDVKIALLFGAEICSKTCKNAADSIWSTKAIFYDFEGVLKGFLLLNIASLVSISIL